MIVVAAFKSPAVVTGLDDVAMVSQAVEQRGGHLGVAEHARPFSECEVGGDDDGRALVEPADEMEQELAAGLSKREVTELVEDDEVHPGQMLGEPPLPSVAGLDLQTVDEIDNVVEAPAGTGTNAASGDGDSQMGLAGAGAADQHGVTLLGDEASTSEIVDQRLVDGGALELEVLKVLGERGLAMVSWYLIERACFSLISALSRSPTMRWGSDHFSSTVGTRNGLRLAV